MTDKYTQLVSQGLGKDVAKKLATKQATYVFSSPLHRAVQIVVALPVDEERVGAGLDELVQKEIGIRDHQMDLERKLGHPPKGLDDRRAHGQIRHEMSVHHVDVDPVGSSLFRLGYLLAQPCEVRGENRRGELHGVLGSHVLDASKML